MPVTVVPVPDMLGALIAELRSYSELTTLTSTRISGQFDKSWPLAANGNMTHAIVMRKAGVEPSASRAAVALQMQRVDFVIYGSNTYEATRVWRVLHAILVPADPNQVNSFVRAGCRFYNFEHRAGPFDESEEQTEYPIVLASYSALWGEVPAT